MPADSGTPAPDGPSGEPDLSLPARDPAAGASVPWEAPDSETASDPRAASPALPGSEPVAGQPPEGPPDRPDPLADPIAFASSEGASPSVLRWVEMADGRVPGRVLRGAGFWMAVHARFGRHRGPVLAGGLAFFGMLSLVPAFLSLAAVTAMVIDPASVATAANTILTNNPQAAETLEPVIDLAVQAASAGSTSASLTALVSLAVSLYAASRFIYVGHQVLDTAFESHPKPPTLIKRFGAIAVTLVLQLAFVVALVVLGLVPRVLAFLGVAEAYETALRTLRQPLAIGVVYLLLTASMRYATRGGRGIPWLNPGAAAGTLIVAVGTLGLSWFLEFSRTYSEIVAVMGGVIALELWLYVIGTAIVVSAETEGVRARVRREILAGTGVVASR